MKLFDKLSHSNRAKNDFKLRCFSRKPNVNTDQCSYKEIDVLEALDKNYMKGEKLINDFQAMVDSMEEELKEERGEEFKNGDFSSIIIAPLIFLYKKYKESILNHLPQIVDKLIKKGLVIEHPLQHQMDLNASWDIEFPIIRNGKVTSVLNQHFTSDETCKNEYDLKMLNDEIKNHIKSFELNRTQIYKVNIDVNGLVDGKLVNEKFSDVNELEKFCTSIIAEPQPSIRMSP